MHLPASRPPNPDPRPLTPISALLIANRGEIASRIIRTCRSMGIRSIAVFSDADRYSAYVRAADTAVFIGESSPAASYLNPDRIIAAAKQAGADAIHPGYGFLSENAAFARRCAAEGLIFIGPHPNAIAAMGSKSQAKSLMTQHGVPVVPGYQGPDQSLEKLVAAARSLGFPLLLKAAAGGGGKGMRIVQEEGEIRAAIEAAQRGARNAFGDDELILEKYIDAGRHIEFQIFGDRHGNLIHLLERECTIQRRYQKVIEESPSPVMDEALRSRMGEAAVRAARALNYDNVGTVEFIYDENSGEFYFLEVNTRLQVEHPVTEAITGLDLVQMQIESAQGLPLALRQEEVRGRGYAIEVRLYAEDPARDFLPVTGTILRFVPPVVAGLRVETAIFSGAEISTFYDPMIAKLIVWEASRQAAHRKMQYVLRNLVCLGTNTNQALLLHLLENPDFQAGRYDTHFIRDRINLKSLGQPEAAQGVLALIAAMLHGWQAREQARTLLRALPSGWRNNFNDSQQETYLFGEQAQVLHYRYLQGRFHVRVGASAYEVRPIFSDREQVRFETGGMQYAFQVAQQGADIYLHHAQTGAVHLHKQARLPARVQARMPGAYVAPMPAQVVKVLVAPGQAVRAGEGLLVLSSMKMENTIEAVEDGLVEEVYAVEGGVFVAETDR